ncbi:probable serine hydrolase isoform X3 [Neocloeon triangulifer]|uniref:probable serine hydrolase isoform X3 n=1 Tax=Neocloeon triangulifer TaxID=2078957 RepID=UPI00286ED2E7|nr:probable serine hydrolase isoform X3 [Neocloeon triangulifer]
MIQRCLSANGLRTWRQLKSVRTLQKIQYRQLSQVGSSQEQPERKWEEVRIPVPWGHIAGKWWGPRSRQPILAIHGWMDNANTFDPLIGLLPSDLSFLAIDLPGHGLSSRYPAGMVYHSTEDIVVLRRIVKHFDWRDKLVLMGHSLGSIYSFTYSSAFPNEVEKYIGFDNIKPTNINNDKFIKETGGAIDRFLRFIANPDFSPEYPWDNIVERQRKGSSESLTIESTKLLLQRGAYKSLTKEGHFGFRRDIRQMVSLLSTLPYEHIQEMARRISCEVLSIKFKQAPYYEDPKYCNGILEIIRNNAKRLEYHEVDGSHHGHLNNPENVAPIVKNFLRS